MLLRIKLTDRVTNKSVLEQIGTKRKIRHLINDRKLKYIGNASRNKNINLITKAYQGKLDAKRKKGRNPIIDWPFLLILIFIMKLRIL